MDDYEHCVNCGQKTIVPVDYGDAPGLIYPQTVFCSEKCEQEHLESHTRLSNDKPQIKPEGLHIGCPVCSSAALQAPMDLMIAAGFGSAYVEKDGEKIYDGEADFHQRMDAKTVGDIEKMAAADPEHDWRIVIDTPLHGETFQRQAPGKWVCIESNKGFA